MAKRPFFSIITVTWNNLPGLKKTQDSLAIQKCRDFEWLVIDGGSKDGTLEFLQDFDGWISEPDSGLYDAMNKGIARANGEYLLFLNAGDTLAEASVLEKIKQQSGSADFIYGDSFEDGHYKPARAHVSKNWGMFTHHQAMIYKRETVGDMRYQTAYKIGADYDFTCRLLKKADTVSYLPFPVCVFETGGVSQRNAKDGRREQFTIRKNLQTNAFENYFIYAAQSFAWALRAILPGFYWRLKSSGNSGSGPAQA